MAMTDNAGIGLAMGMAQLSLGRSSSNYPLISTLNEAHENGGAAPDQQLYDQLQEQQQSHSNNQQANGGANGHGVKGDAVDEDARSNGSNNSMRELEDLLTKLNPLAKEFVPPSLNADHGSATATSSKGQARKVRK